jgi:two-component system nitrogen regulation response regulator GlnG
MNGTPIPLGPGLAQHGKLLLIDDDPDLLPDQIAHVFPSPEHRVEVAPTGAEGLRRAAAERPDVIVLDLRLPDQSGLDVLK